jgi:HSP20 family protein
MDKPKKSETSDQPIVPFWRQGWTELDRVFDNFRKDFERTLWFPTMTIPSFSVSSLSCDVADEGDHYVITTEMPGVSKEDVKLNVSDNTIEISAEHKEEEEEKKKNFVRKERKSVSYHRTLPLPEKVDSSKATAKLNNGILTVEITKVIPTPKPKRASIPVQ